MSVLLLILAFPLFGFLLNGTLAFLQARGRTIPQKISGGLACLMPLLSFFYCVKIFSTLAQNPSLTQISASNLLPWMSVGPLEISFGLTLDHLSSVMSLIVTGVGFLIHVYSTAYMKEDPAYARYFSYLNLFLFFMLILIMADSLILLFVGWEGVGLCSYLLIGFWFTDVQKAKAGKKAFVVNRIGDFALLLALFFVAWLLAPSLSASADQAQPIFEFSYLAAHTELLKPWIVVITLCLFFAATGKSAQIPLYVWLPDAMAGPTPVSALIHAATMVTAGIYMIARLHFLFVLAPLTLDVTATIGLATAFTAALIGVTQYDIKKVLAYSTVSQLGYMFLALGVGGFSAAIFHVMTHAFFKACLFLGAGSVIHGLHHEQDIRRMGGLAKRMPVTAFTFLIATLAISGFPPFSGFFSKDEILYLTYANAPHKAYYIVALLTAGITAFYMMRLFVYTFLGKCRYAHPDHIHESPFSMTSVLSVLAFLSLVGGLVGVPHVLHPYLPLTNVWEFWLAFLGQKTPHAVAGVLQEVHLMLISSAWAVLCSLTAFFLYRRNLNFAVSIKSALSFLYDLVENKFYVDQIYDFLIVRPIHFFSDRVLYRVADVKLIDRFLIHGLADVSTLIAKTIAITQTGFLGHCLFFLLLGLCVLVYLLVGNVLL